MCKDSVRAGEVTGFVNSLVLGGSLRLKGVTRIAVCFRDCLKTRGVLKIVTRLNLECVFVTLTAALSHGERELTEPVPSPSGRGLG